MNNDTSEPAFPALGRWGNGSAPESALQQDGMTLRDYFAAKAMQAYLSGPDRDSFTFDEWAVPACEMADAMLKARSA